MEGGREGGKKEKKRKGKRKERKNGNHAILPSIHFPGSSFTLDPTSAMAICCGPSKQGAQHHVLPRAVPFRKLID